jgi:hypothetical protein
MANNRFDALWGRVAFHPNPQREALSGLSVGSAGTSNENGEPGWLVLHRGLQTLRSCEAGFEGGLQASGKA